MNTDSQGTMSQEYRSAFILDKAKLSRIIRILEEKFHQSGNQPTIRYDFQLSKGANLELSNLDALFELDNTVRNHIKSLNIIVNAGDKAADSPSCHIKFTPLDLSEDSKAKNVILKVVTPDTRFSTQIFDELDEQIQRTFFVSWNQFSGMFEILGILGVLGIAILVFLFLSPILAPNLYNVPLSEVRLDYKELEHLSEQARLANSLDDRINFLFNLMSHQVKTALVGSGGAPFARFISRANIPSLVNLNTFLIILPVIIVLSCLAYIAVLCSPSAVFLWGDYEEHYKNLVSRRNALLSIITTVIALGILTNLAANALWLSIAR